MYRWLQFPPAKQSLGPCLAGGRDYPPLSQAWRLATAAAAIAKSATLLSSGARLPFHMLQRDLSALNPLVDFGFGDGQLVCRLLDVAVLAAQGCLYGLALDLV